MPTARSARRLTTALVITLLLLFAATGFAAHGLSNVQGDLRQIEVDDREQRSAAEMREHVHELSAATRDLVMENDLALMRPITDRIALESTGYDNAEATLGVLLARNTDVSVEERDLLQQIRVDKALAWPAITRVIALGAVNDDANATQLLATSVKPAVTRWLAALNRLESLQQRRNEHAVRDAQAVHDRAVALLVFVCVAAFAVSATAAWGTAAQPPHQASDKP